MIIFGYVEKTYTPIRSSQGSAYPMHVSIQRAPVRVTEEQKKRIDATNKMMKETGLSDVFSQFM